MSKVMALLTPPPDGGWATEGGRAFGLDVAIDGDRAVLSLWLGPGEEVPPLPPGTAVWWVDERVQWDQGDREPGVKWIAFVRRLPSLTREEFASHWSERHAPLARRHHPAIRRYVQNVVVDRRDEAPDVDGIAELSFQSLDDMEKRLYDSPEGRAIIAEDVRRFIDRGAGTRVLAREKVLRR